MNTKELFNLPNMLSLSRVLFGIIFFGLFFTTSLVPDNSIISFILFISAFIIFIIGIITDGLDGYYARKFNIVTDLGKHLDPLTDSIFFIIVFAAFSYFKLMPFVFFVLITVREVFMHLFLRPYAKKCGGSLPANIYGKLKTFAQCIFSGLVIFILTIISYMKYKDMNPASLIHFNNQLSFILFLIIVFLSLMSILIYIINFKKYVK